VAPLTLGLFFAAACRPPPEADVDEERLNEPGAEEERPMLPRAPREPALNA
jgi:hypothetical protein